MAEFLLSKIEIGGQVYNLKDAYAREQIALLLEDAAKHMDSTGIFANDSDVKNYVDAQVGAINKFDVKVLTDGQALPTAGADTMYVLYLKPETDSASGAYVEWITIRSGEEGAYTYTWEAIGSTKMDVTGFVTSEALADALDDYELKANLGDLAYKDNATGTVEGQVISGVKATGKSTGSITVELEQSEHVMDSTGKYTPAGNVAGTVVTDGSIAVTAKYDAADAVLSKGDYTPAGTITSDFSHADTAATLEYSKHAPEGNVTVTLTNNNINSILDAGTQASFTEGKFNPATLDYAAADYSVAKEGLVGKVEEECLTFSTAALEAISASKITGFNGGSKESDTFVANSLPTFEGKTIGADASFAGKEHDCVSGVKYAKASLNTLTFTGTKAENALVTGVSYQKADIGSATFTGKTVDIAASFTGTEGDVNVAGKCHDYAVKTAEFNSADIELNVGDIAVAAKDVTVQ